MPEIWSVSNIYSERIPGTKDSIFYMICDNVKDWTSSGIYSISSDIPLLRLGMRLIG